LVGVGAIELFKAAVGEKEWLRRCDSALETGHGYPKTDAGAATTWTPPATIQTSEPIEAESVFGLKRFFDLKGSKK
jgi:hypothetical protein